MQLLGLRENSSEGEEFPTPFLFIFWLNFPSWENLQEDTIFSSAVIIWEVIGLGNNRFCQIYSSLLYPMRTIPIGYSGYVLQPSEYLGKLPSHVEITVAWCSFAKPFKGSIALPFHGKKPCNPLFLLPLLWSWGWWTASISPGYREVV